jgi:uncharacterized membrane protein YvlD (DUF360 family)
MITNALFGTLAALLVGWMLWRFVRSVNRAAVDPIYRRRRLIRFGMLYVVAGVIGIVLVVTRQEPVLALAGLPVVAWLAWSLFRAASQIKVPPL